MPQLLLLIKIHNTYIENSRSNHLQNDSLLGANMCGPCGNTVRLVCTEPECLAAEMHRSMEPWACVQGVGWFPSPGLWESLVSFPPDCLNARDHIHDGQAFYYWSVTELRRQYIKSICSRWGRWRLGSETREFLTRGALRTLLVCVHFENQLKRVSPQ